LRTQSGASAKSGGSAGPAPDADGELAADGEALSLPTAVGDGDGVAAGEVLAADPLPDGPTTGALVHAAAIATSSAAVPRRRCNGIAR
jgi:hypothetical protein